MRITTVAALILCTVAVAQTASPLAPIEFMIGEWHGKSSGRPGEGTVHRVCERVLNDRFIECRSTVTYPPQEKNPKGEVHVERAFFSYDKAAKTIRLRQFHGESFVVTYSADEAGRVFVSDHVENTPAGWRARETYETPSADKWIERFDLAAAGKEFTTYSSSTLERAKK